MRFVRRLVRRRDPDAPPRLRRPDELVLLARPSGEPEAQMLRELLAQQGVQSLVKNLDPVSAQSGGMGPPWAYELWVLRRDLRRAREIIGSGGP
jgi:hypothetical protein